MTDYNIAYSELTDTYQIQSIVEAEQKAMCESCIYKVSVDDIKAIRNDAINECIEVVERYTYDCSIVEKLERLKEKSNELDF